MGNFFVQILRIWEKFIAGLLNANFAQAECSPEITPCKFPCVDKRSWTGPKGGEALKLDRIKK